jgi:hypothetical protein
VNKWWKNVRVRSLGLLVVGLSVGVVGLQLGREARWDPQWVFAIAGVDVVAWLLVGASLSVGLVCTVAGSTWVVFAAPAVRAAESRAILVFCCSAGFALVAVLTGVWTDWDMLAPVGSRHRNAPAGVLIVLSLILALPGSIASVRTYLLGPDTAPQKEPKPWTTRRIFDEDGKRIHYDD